MINKKNELGKNPVLLGVKDAVHVAIVSVCAGQALKSGEWFTMNEDGNAIRSTPNKGIGIVDPFLNRTIATGESFWGILSQTEIPNVQHTWEHPQFTFATPANQPPKNKYFQREADSLGVTYEQLMNACSKMVYDNQETPYPGKDFDKAVSSYDEYDLWGEWAEETGYEFYNVGTECCPEYDYPGFPFYNINK